MGRRLLLVLSLLATLVVTTGGAPAAAAAGSAPTVFHLAPAFGAVVDAGQTVLRAVALADADIVETELVLDGATLPNATASGPARERRVSAVVTTTPGDHVATLRVRDAAGRTTSRSWRFTASSIKVVRHAAPTAVDQAARLSARTFPETRSRDAAVLARYDELADALTGVPLAQHVEGPLLLTERARLSAATRSELTRVLAPGATVHVLGGGAAVASGVDEELRDLGFSVRRHFGPDRYATAAQIALAMPPSPRVFIASGTSFADALAASAPAARDGAPILLTSRDRLADPTTRYLRDHAVTEAVIAGGAGVVGGAVADRIGQEVDRVVRVGGRDRTATAALLVDRFYPSARDLGVADAASMADALLGARHAAQRGAPLLLAPRGEALGSELDRTVRRLSPAGILAYGRSDALGTPTLLVLRRAAQDGPAVTRVVGSDPARGATVHGMDTIIVDLDREVELAPSNLYVELDGVEVVGRTVAGDFTDTLVFQVERIHTTVEPGVPYEVRVVVVVHEGGSWSHDELRFTYVKQQLARGDAGSEVEYVQRRLTDLGYWLGAVDGQYGSLTAQAVMAFEKVHGLPRDGVLDDRVRALLETAERPRAHTTHSYVVEVDKARQVLFIARYGRVEWILNTSTGTEDYYTYEGQRKLATTPTGTFRVSRQIDGLREAPLGTLWRPKYFNGGIAVHGSTSVPGYPASHGCVRLTYAAMDWIWEQDLMPIGTTVVVH